MSPWVVMEQLLLLTSQLSGASSPQGNRRPSEPSAANSHSASLGRRLPAHSQYSRAWNQVTPAAGWMSNCPSSR